MPQPHEAWHPKFFCDKRIPGWLPHGLPFELTGYVGNLQTWTKERWALYDSLTYAHAGGAGNMNFFQQVSGANNTTLEDTNMYAAGSMPAEQAFLVESLEFLLIPSFAYTAADLPAALQTATFIANRVNDEWEFRAQGAVVFRIGSKNYVEQGPLMKFPPKVRFDVQASASLYDAGAEALAVIAQGSAIGRPWHFTPEMLLLEPTQNFNVNVIWPGQAGNAGGSPALSTGHDARLKATLDGFLYRRAQ